MPKVTADNLADFQILADLGRSELERREAFERMLTRRGGWHGDATMMEYVTALAKHPLKGFLPEDSKGSDLVGVQDVVEETLLLLWTKAPTIRDRSSLGAWLWGVVKYVVKHDVADARLFQRADLDDERVAANWPESR